MPAACQGVKASPKISTDRIVVNSGPLPPVTLAGPGPIRATASEKRNEGIVPKQRQRQRDADDGKGIARSVT